MATSIHLVLSSFLLVAAAAISSNPLSSQLEASIDEFVESEEDDQHGISLLSKQVVIGQTTLSAEEKHLSKSQSGPWTFYHYSIFPLLIITALTAWFTRPQLDNPDEMTPIFRLYRYKFLAVWALAAAADWLQGPYVYALYESFGYTKSEIDKLFVAGFLASMVFSTFAGSIGDAWGRKRMALLYCVLYIVSCLSKHFSTYSVLMFGRITGGMATALLFSAFECWMVSESNQRYQLSGALLRYMFSLMYFVNYLVAIVSGLVAQVFVDSVPLRRVQGFDALHYGGNICPFDLAILVLSFAFLMICLFWHENYGTSDSLKILDDKEDVAQAFFSAAKAISNSWEIAVLGLVVGCFEGGMYCFVLNWTPTLSVSGAPQPPHGLIFSAMMMCCMIGSSVFSFFNPDINPAKVVVKACFVAGLSFLFVAMVCGKSEYVCSMYTSFLVFELCVGLYFPAIGTLKSHLVPEEVRAGIYNWYRIPLNIIVCCVILTDLQLQKAFIVCSLLMLLGTTLLLPNISAKFSNRDAKAIAREA